ncbi:TraR/DksA C4-type zinc finger protein [Pseudomonas sp. CCI4.2]|uniref:TraR/DksA C4-type zinc finger protein n=1 Tax=Pseudomonas sp. CCI4.2 TaxID=3048620 RepID=UPI002AC9CA19|nr:TraR/DksA C4-type zinc finger protein [Pseudomonas sp. CCI4.2]MEB0090067.1 TraR/DksA C4-type zinc finger protein [Pseudomonas sp. CCI4.2]WPX53469.1 TraR/DksA C4-type zinc finger protein [Pseudomonas sp. CCI4.2]
MADWLDDAQVIEELERKRSIEGLLARPRPSGPSRSHCLTCDDKIPARRQAMGAIVRCVPCQTTFEKGNRR